MRLLFWLGLLAATPANADMADFFGEFFSRPAKFKQNAAYRVGDLNEKTVNQQPFDHRWHEFTFGFPVSEGGDGSVWRLSHHSHVEELKTNATFPVSQRPVPTTLWNTGMTGMYSKDLSENRRVTASVTVGSTADRPFYSAREVSFGARAMYRQPAGEKSQFLLMLDFSNTRNFSNWVPLPGVAWLIDLDPDYKLVAGLPFLGFFAMPLDKLMVTWFYLPPTNTMFRVGYRLFGPAQIFSHFKWNLRNWFLHDRSDEFDERIYSQEKEVLMGITMPVAGGLLAEASGGMWFDRRWWTGRDYKHRHKGRMFNVDDAAFAQMKVSYGW